jgi:SAM-dependent methyltransferase
MDSSAWDARYAASDLVWSAEPNRFVAAECADLPPGRAVDLAAGEGRNAIWLASLGWRVTAVDFSQVALDKGRSMAPDAAVDWVRADATTWRADDGYDLAVIAYLQLPAGERRAAERNAFASLRTRGTLLLVGHDSSNLAHGSGGPQDPDVLYTADDVLGDLADASAADVAGSFEVVRAGRVERPVTDPAGITRIAYDCLVRLVRTRS